MTPSSISPSTPATDRLRRQRALRRLLAVLCAFTLLAAACGGSDADDGAADDSDSSSSSSSDAGDDASTDDGGTDDGGNADDGDDDASAATGDPIKVMSVTTLNANGPTYENIAITAELFADTINAQGGINGRPLEVTVCDEQFDPAIAATCARDAVESGTVAIIGSFTYFAESIVPVIADAGITWFGACCPISPSELSSPYSFNIGNQPMYAVGAIKRAVDDGCENINAVIAEGADAIFLPPMENAMSAFGRTFGDVVLAPPVAQDYSAEVARASEGADCVITIMSETPFLAWNNTWAQSGTEARQYGPQGNLNDISAVGAEEATDGDIIAGMYPDISTSAWDDYRAALDAAGIDQTEYDFNSLGGMGTWAAYTAFAQIAETIDGDVTAESFYEAANSTDSLDLGGMVPVLDFTQEWTDGLPGYNRLFNRSVVYSELDNGKVVPLTTDFEDVGDLALGNAPG